MNRILKLTLLLVPLLVSCGRAPQFTIIEQPSDSPLITLRATFLTGAASDPENLPGLANLTASMLSDGGTTSLTYQQILEAMFPMATSVHSQVDKEMTTFSFETHIDNLDATYNLFRAMLLEPGWRDDDLTRLRDQTTNALLVSLRGDNDEELGKEYLYNQIYAGHPYGHHNMGTASGLKAITLDDMKQFYQQNYTQSNLIVAVAGHYPQSFITELRNDLGTLPVGTAQTPTRPQPAPIEGINVRLIDKPTNAVAFSIGFPIDVKRGDPDFLPLLVMESYFGPHRNSSGRLFTRMRAIRGLNYGDYAYIEYFPNGMFQFEPSPNLARPEQIFQIWIRPVEPATAHFALRLAMFELDNLIKNGLTEEQFETTRSYLTKYTNLLLKTKQAELGYAIDSRYYNIPAYTEYVRSGLESMTVDDVNRAIRAQLHTDNLYITVVTPNAEQFKEELLAGDPSPMTYNSPKPKEILDEDKTVESWPIPIASAEVVPVDQVFE